MPDTIRSSSLFEACKHWLRLRLATPLTSRIALDRRLRLPGFLPRYRLYFVSVLP